MAVKKDPLVGNETSKLLPASASTRDAAPPSYAASTSVGPSNTRVPSHPQGPSTLPPPSSVVVPAPYLDHRQPSAISIANARARRRFWSALAIGIVIWMALGAVTGGVSCLVLMGAICLTGCYLSLFNSIQNFLTTKLTRRVYNKAPGSVNGLQARTFAIWTLASALIRIQAAYNLDSKPLYDLALGSYVLALGHFLIEALVFRTAGFGPGLLSPLIVASTSLIWMTKQYSFYVR